MKNAYEATLHITCILAKLEITNNTFSKPIPALNMVYVGDQYDCPFAVAEFRKLFIFVFLYDCIPWTLANQMSVYINCSKQNGERGKHFYFALIFTGNASFHKLTVVHFIESVKDILSRIYIDTQSQLISYIFRSYIMTVFVSLVESLSTNPCFLWEWVRWHCICH